MTENVPVQDCTLCGACRSACPVDAIQMTAPYLDFFYPKIDPALCLHCGRCRQACPVLHPPARAEGSDLLLSFAAKSTDDAVRMRSSSGGVFYALADRMLRDGGAVCGAVFDESFHVNHLLSRRREDLLRMMGSKYAQSEMGTCYREVKRELTAGRPVLFSGCPCQIAGLRSYLGKAYPELLLVELICHGAPSDSMLQTYIKYQEKRHGASLTRLEFRSKVKGWHRSTVRMEFANGKTYSEAMTLDTYMQGYFRCITLKEACFSCKFRGFSSGSDVTIGDFWGAEAALPALDDNKGLSVVIAHSQKAAAFLASLPLKLVPVGLETIVPYNQSLVRSFAAGEQREAFYAFAAEHGLDAAIKQFFSERFFQRLKRKGRFALRWAWHIVRGKGRPIY